MPKWRRDVRGQEEWVGSFFGPLGVCDCYGLNAGQMPGWMAELFPHLKSCLLGTHNSIWGQGFQSISFASLGQGKQEDEQGLIFDLQLPGLPALPSVGALCAWSK